MNAIRNAHIVMHRAFMQSKKKITINWAALLAFAIFWLWGINSYPTGSALNNFSVNVFIIFLFAYFVYNYSSDNFRTTFTLDTKIISAFILLSGFIVFLSWRHLVQPLWGDQIYHAQYAARHGQLAIFMMEHNFPSLWLGIKDIPAYTIIWVINFVLVIVFGLIFVLLPRYQATHRKALVVLMLLMLVTARAIFIGESNIFFGLTEPANLLHYDWDQHPIFRLSPLLLSSTIFGVSDFGYRAAAFLGYLFFLLFVFTKLNIQVGWRLAFSAVLALGTLPILWHVSYLVEQSAWSTLASATVFVLLFSSKDLESVPLIPAIVLVLIATLLRSPAFIAFAPLAIVISYRALIGNIRQLDRAPILILIATLTLFVLIATLRGSPATGTEGHLSKLLFSQTNNIPGIAAVSVLGLTPFFFVGFALRAATREGIVLFVATILFFAFCGLVYYAPVTRNLWGVGRYQAEMYVPLITAGIVAYCMALPKDRANQWFAVAPLIVLAMVNIFSLATFDSRSFRPFTDNPTPGEAVKSEVEYPTKETFQFIGKHKLQSHTYYVGIYYGGFVSVLRGYSAEQYLNFSRLNNRYRHGFSVNTEAISGDPEIRSVVVEPEADSGVIQGLRERGWKGQYDFTHAKSGRKLTVLTRENI
jgi:hypothetical protein